VKRSGEKWKTGSVMLFEKKKSSDWIIDGQPASYTLLFHRALPGAKKPGNF
jgi:hypothetical protein